MVPTRAGCQETQLRHCTDTHTHTHTALRRPFTIPGSWSNTISVFILIPVPRPVNSLPPPNKIPSLAFLKKSVPQSTCDRLFMNISYTRGLKGSTLARLRALWERKEPTEMNSDTRLPSPSREEKRQNKSCKQGGRVTHLVEHCWVALCSLQQGTALWPFNTSSKHGTTGRLLTATKGLTSMRKAGSHAQSMLFCCSLILVNIHPVTKHLGPQQGLTGYRRNYRYSQFAETR